MLTIFHGSDLHFGKAFDPAAAEAFRRAVEDASPDVVVLSGDFTQRAKIREFEEARAFLRRLPVVPTVVTPGNHDVPLYRIWERIGAPLRNYRHYVSTDLDAVTRVPGATVVALNSTAPHRAIVNGRITDHQLRFAASAFSEAPEDDIKVVVAHHHMASAPDYESDAILPGYQRCLDAFARMGVELVLGGHLHRGYVACSRDVYPGGSRYPGLVIVHSGTSTSKRGRARERSKNSGNIIRVRQDDLEIIRQIYFAELDGFAPVDVRRLPRAGKEVLEQTPTAKPPEAAGGMPR